MFSPIRLIFILSLLFFISACSTLSKKECQKGEWSNIGAKDAIKGYRAKSQLGQHNSACAKHNISPNNKLYYSGYATGLKTFCTRKKGFSYGADGSEYHATCPASLKNEFLIGYLSGLHVAIHETNNRIDDLRHDRRKARRKLHSLEDRQNTKDRISKDKKGDKDKKGGNKHKKLNNHLNNLSSSISSERSKRSKLQGWHDVWSQ